MYHPASPSVSRHDPSLSPSFQPPPIREREFRGRLLVIRTHQISEARNSGVSADWSPRLRMEGFSNILDWCILIFKSSLQILARGCPDPQEVRRNKAQSRRPLRTTGRGAPASQKIYMPLMQRRVTSFGQTSQVFRPVALLGRYPASQQQ